MNRHRKKLEQFAAGAKPLNKAIVWALAEIDRPSPPTTRAVLGSISGIEIRECDIFQTSVREEHLLSWKDVFVISNEAAFFGADAVLRNIGLDCFHRIIRRTEDVVISNAPAADTE